MREKARLAVSRAHEFQPFQPTLPATVQLTFYRSDMCENVAFLPDTERVDARTMSRTIGSLVEVRAW